MNENPKKSKIDRNGEASGNSISQQLIGDFPVRSQSRESVRVQLLLPLHNEEENIAAVVSDTLHALIAKGYDPRILLVDDGSTDDSLAVIVQLAEKHAPYVGFISLSRNFGKEAALTAGIEECGNDFDLLAYMDSDGQHSSADLLRLIERAELTDAEIICGVRIDRGYQTTSQRLLTRGFYRVFHLLTDQRIDAGAGDFNVMRPKVVVALRALKEPFPFMKGLVAWVGFKRDLVPITIEERAKGTAKSSTKKMLRLAFGAFLSFSSWPLRAWSVIGVASATLALLYLVLVIFNTLAFGRDVPGYASIVVLLLGLGGLQLLSIGIVGEYVARVYDASKQRPRYLIAAHRRCGPYTGTIRR